MSGNDADGTAGLDEIAQSGGLVIAQSVESAKFETMPKSAIESRAVVRELEPAKIPEQLVSYYSDLEQLRTADQEKRRNAIIDRLDDIASRMRRETGHDFSHFKTSTLVRRIQRRMRVLRFIEIDEYVDYLIGHHHLVSSTPSLVRKRLPDR